jgi:hypothetical protein
LIVGVIKRIVGGRINLQKLRIGDIVVEMVRMSD